MAQRTTCAGRCFRRAGGQDQKCALAAHSSHPQAGSAALLVALPPPKARRQPAAAARKQRHGVTAALRNISMSTILAAVAAAPLAPGKAGAAQGCARLLFNRRCRLRGNNLRCRAGRGVWAVGSVMPPARPRRRQHYRCQHLAAGAQAAQAGQPSRQTLHWQNRLEGQGCRLHPPTRGLTLWLRQRWHADRRGAVGQGQRAALALGHCSSSRVRSGSAGVKSMPITAGAGSKQPSLPGRVDPLLQSNAGCRATLTPISDNGRALIAQLQVVAPSGIPPRLVPALRRRCAGGCLCCRKCLQGV